MAGVRKLGTKVPRPKAKVKSLSLFPRVPQPRRTGGKSYTKAALQEDPSKFGNFGFDINQLAPSIEQMGTR